jgi:8-oxoguanine deaminase
MRCRKRLTRLSTRAAIWSCQGLINTHHHMYQSLTRAIPGVQNAELFSWLQRPLPDLGESDTRDGSGQSTQVAMAELLMSGLHHQQ